MAKDCKDTKKLLDNKAEELCEDKITEALMEISSFGSDASMYPDDDKDSFKMLTKTAGTLAFAAPERLADNCFYT